MSRVAKKQARRVNGFDFYAVLGLHAWLLIMLTLSMIFGGRVNSIFSWIVGAITIIALAVRHIHQQRTEDSLRRSLVIEVARVAYADAEMAKMRRQVWAAQEHQS